LLGICIAIAMFAFAAGGSGGPRATEAAPEPTANVTFTLYGSTSRGWGFTSSTITSPGPTLVVTKGDHVFLNLFAADSAPHTWFADYDGDLLADVNEPLSDLFVTGGLMFDFFADVAGRFTYWCDIHYGAMRGILDVREANAAPSVGAILASPGNAIPGQEVSLSAASTDPDGDVLTYTWQFGDGTSATGSTDAGGGMIVVGHAFPRARTFSVTVTVQDGKGGSATSSTEVRIATPALLRATTNPAVPGKILVDGVPRDEWGLTWMKIAAGPHTVSFSDLAGLAPPDPISIEAVEGQTSVVQGNYVIQGFLRVVTEPAIPGTIYVDGQPNNDWGMWREAATGTYRVSFGAVAGYTPPAPRDVTVVAGATASTTGVYTSNPSAPGPDPSTFGLLRVTTNPPLASTIFVDGIPRDDWGLTWVKIAPGTHTVSFATVYGATPPPPTRVTVVAGQTTTYAAPFNVHGSLRVTTSPAVAATVYIDGIPRNDWGIWQSMEPGTYRISFGPLPGFSAPQPQVATVNPNALTLVEAPYFAIQSRDATPQQLAGLDEVSLLT